jgi:hypothetical protein
MTTNVPANMPGSVSAVAATARPPASAAKQPQSSGAWFASKRAIKGLDAAAWDSA